MGNDTAMVMDLAELDRVLHEEVFERFDHRHMNFDIPEFAFGKQVPTSEALAVYIWNRVAPRLPSGVRLERVRVQEDPYLYAEYDGIDDA
jgi:6-pyruvoyltetrahydropterin/6-carboxytetrahydropterin synthase